MCAILIGILLGHFYPSVGVDMKPFSEGFIVLIRAVVPLIIFATVAVGIAKMGDMRRVGVVGLRALIYFEVVSTLALIVGLAVGNLLQPGSDPVSNDEEEKVAPAQRARNAVDKARSLFLLGIRP